MRNPIKLYGDLYKRIQDDIKQDPNETFGSGLIQERLIIAAWRTETLDILEKYRFVLNKIIKQKKEMKRVQEALNKKNDTTINNNGGVCVPGNSEKGGN